MAARAASSGGCNGQVVEEGLNLDDAARRQVQRSLEATVFDPGGADGVCSVRGGVRVAAFLGDVVHERAGDGELCVELIDEASGLLVGMLDALHLIAVAWWPPVGICSCSKRVRCPGSSAGPGDRARMPPPER